MPAESTSALPALADKSGVRDRTPFNCPAAAGNAWVQTGDLVMQNLARQLSNLPEGDPGSTLPARDNVATFAPVAEPTLTLISQLRDEGQSLSRIAQYLNHHGFASAQGGRWYGATVLIVLRRLQRDDPYSATNP